MVVIRRMVDRRMDRVMLPGEPPRVFPTTDQEHARILQIYLQDKPYHGVHNDFSDFGIGLPPQPASGAPQTPKA